MSIGDFGRISSYGEVNRNGKDKVVLTDYGLTEDIFKNFYQRKTIDNY